ncbi:MAG: hypothetical protein U0T74_14360 [Chitinophagales bacterium]
MVTTIKRFIDSIPSGSGVLSYSGQSGSIYQLGHHTGSGFGVSGFGQAQLFKNGSTRPLVFFIKRQCNYNPFLLTN